MVLTNVALDECVLTDDLLGGVHHPHHHALQTRSIHVRFHLLNIQVQNEPWSGRWTDLMMGLWWIHGWLKKKWGFRGLQLGIQYMFFMWGDDGGFNTDMVGPGSHVTAWDPLGGGSQQF
jgi:hypothetical protein